MIRQYPLYPEQMISQPGAAHNPAQNLKSLEPIRIQVKLEFEQLLHWVRFVNSLSHSHLIKVEHLEAQLQIINRLTLLAQEYQSCLNQLKPLYQEEPESVTTQTAMSSLFTSGFKATVGIVKKVATAHLFVWNYPASIEKAKKESNYIDLSEIEGGLKANDNQLTYKNSEKELEVIKELLDTMKSVLLQQIHTIQSRDYSPYRQGSERANIESSNQIVSQLTQIVVVPTDLNGPLQYHNFPGERGIRL